jgi:hypothetical protein
MDVFDARSHADTGEDTGASSDEPESYESFSAAEPDDDIVFQDNPEEDAAEGHYAGQKTGFAEEELSDSFRDVAPPGEGAGMIDDEDTEDVDESWAEAMLQEEFPDPPARNASGTRPANRQEQPAAQAGPAPSAQRPEAKQATEDPEPARQEAPQTTDDLELTAITAAPPPDQGSADTGRRQNAITGGTFPPLDDVSPYEQFSREPVAVRSRGGGGLRRALWTLVVLALLAGLASQVAWFQFDRLAAIPELRPWYEKACEYAGCELEPLVAMDRIQSRKLVVRTDPENRSALLVDAVIINQADFEQPFPSIALTFSNLNGDVVAQSIFPPDDYLAGEGTDLNAMPPGTPVRIAISIRDPGRDAVNYNLRFVNRDNDS